MRFRAHQKRKRISGDVKTEKTDIVSYIDALKRDDQGTVVEGYEVYADQLWVEPVSVDKSFDFGDFCSKPQSIIRFTPSKHIKKKMLEAKLFITVAEVLIAASVASPMIELNSTISESDVCDQTVLDT